MSNNIAVPDLDTFREPQRQFEHVEVPATAPKPWPRDERPLDARIVGGGRERDVEEFLTVTSSTSCVVIVDGVLVHEWYADGVAAEDRLLGNSATKSALALLTGVAVSRGLLPDLDLPVRDLVPELAGSGYDVGDPPPGPHHDHGRGVGRGLSRPRQCRVAHDRAVAPGSRRDP